MMSIKRWVTVFSILTLLVVHTGSMAFDDDGSDDGGSDDTSTAVF
jgi:hypothetical protein